MRCSSCNKFVSYGDIEAEIVSERVDDSAVVVEVCIALTCAECSQELKEATLEFEQEIEHECASEATDEEQYEITASSADATERQQTTGQDGKPLNRRAIRTFYGASVAVEVKCNWCGETIDVSGDVEEQASAFEEL